MVINNENVPLGEPQKIIFNLHSASFGALGSLRAENLVPRGAREVSTTAEKARTESK